MRIVAGMEIKQKMSDQDGVVTTNNVGILNSGTSSINASSSPSGSGNQSGAKLGNNGSSKHSTIKELELEYGFLRVPFELFNKEFRSSQKSVEKDLSVLEKAVREMMQKATKQNVSPQDQSLFLDKVVTKLRGVKRKLEETDVSELNCLHTCKERLEHLDQYPIVTGSISRRKTISNITDHDYQSLSNWRKTRVNRVIVDYLLRFGKYETAMALSESQNIKNLIDIEVFIQMKSVIEGLTKRNCTEALKWCADNRSRLRKISVCVCQKKLWCMIQILMYIFHDQILLYWMFTK